MRLLVTSSRMPYALPFIRALGHAGHTIDTADTFRSAPGNHSRWVSEVHVTPAPSYSPRAWIDAIREIATNRCIDVVVPMFEEVFYLAAHGPMIGGARVFAAPFPLLSRLHDKRKFADLARELGISVPASRVVSDRNALREASRSFDAFFARPAFSRGGISVLTNTGPLADRVDIEECTPTPENPWIVQAFVSGTDVCTFSVVRDGRVVAHATYEHPRTIESCGGIVFESVDEPRTLDVTQRIVAGTGYHGHISLDFIRGDDGRWSAIECNPRPTAGVAVMPPDMLAEAVFGPADQPVAVAPSGARCSMRSAILRDMFVGGGRLGDDLRELFSATPDMCFALGDAWPGIFQLLSGARLFAYRNDTAHYRKTRSDLMAGYLHDATWDGTPMPDLIGPAGAGAAGTGCEPAGSVKPGGSRSTTHP